MKYPQTIFASLPFFPDEIACAVSFVPTFEPPPPQEMFEVLADEEPESHQIVAHEKLWFVFLFDRSDSMA